MEHQTKKTDAIMMVQGVVTEEVTQDEEWSHYTISSDTDGREYTVLSTGRQAIKDQLFVRKGQYMEFECSEVSEKQADVKLLLRKSKIMLAESEGVNSGGRDERKAAGCIEHHQSAEK